MKYFIYKHIHIIYFIFVTLVLLVMGIWWLQWFYPDFNPDIETYDSSMFLLGIVSLLVLICWIITKNEALKEESDGNLYIFEDDDGSSNLVNIEFNEDIVEMSLKDKKEIVLEVVILHNNDYGKRRY